MPIPLVTDACASLIFWLAVGLGWAVLIGSIVRQYLRDRKDDPSAPEQ